MTPDDEQTIWLFGCTVLGGSGYSLPAGAEVDVGFGHSVLVIQTRNSGRVEQISYPEVASIAITGPGRVTTGGGVIGGGFGITGALEGMALAAILNTLTTRTQIHTILEIITHRGELFVHYGDIEPSALRIALSPVFARLRELDPAWLTDRLNRLTSLRDRNILSAEQCERLTHQLTTPLSPVLESPPSALLTKDQREKLARGLCPDCDAYQAFRREGRNSVTCERCRR